VTHNPCDHPSAIKNSSPVTAVHILRVAFGDDERDDAPIGETNEHEMCRLLLHRLMVIETALRLVAALRRKAAQPASIP
jgi:hypothetical protein